MIEKYKPIVDAFLEKHEMLVALVLLVPFWLRVLINSGIINRRDKTKHFILVLNPFSEGASDHALESVLRFYWKLEDQNIFFKRISNILSFTFWLLLIILILNEAVDY